MTSRSKLSISASKQLSSGSISRPSGNALAVRETTFMRAYRRALEDGSYTELGFQQIEQQKKLAKHHRDALDFSLEWVQSLLKASEGGA